MEAIIRDEGDPEAWLLRARFEIALGKHLDARRAIQRLVRMRPRVAAYLTVAARLFASIGDLHAARKHAVDALSTDPGIVEAWLVKARSDLALGDARAAIPALRMVQQLAPSDDFGTQHEAQALLRKATAG
ncbi:MAG: hypothetical protein HYV09_18345 [Deltaproteobacteria bacterium]|nr:hypothetical protein [Deltaproteobacteria bacterium]